MITMLLEASIPVNTLVVILLGVTGSIALIALAVLLFKAVSVLGQVGKLVKEIGPDIEIISGNVVDITDELAIAVPDVLDDVETVLGAVSVTAESASSVVSGITDGITSFMGSKRHKAPSQDNTVNQALGILSGILGLINANKSKSNKKKR
ncbi:MAG: hypothetical protein GX850_07020 [Clostridiaceae bacterium]|nr:hypothetical protein [Clostridiaceae bacterium]